MKHLLLLPLLLLGTVASLHLKNDVPHLDSQETQAHLSQALEGPGDQEEEIQSGEQVETSSCQDDFEDETAMDLDPSDEDTTELDPSALDSNLQCPRKEDTVEIQGSPGCKTCHYWLVWTPKPFRRARKICRRCYRGNLVSIHNFGINNYIRALTSRLNQGQVWIGGIRKSCRFRWVDGSAWNFANWASGQPGNGRGRCVTLCTRGGQWRRRRCGTWLPFVCYS